MMKRLLLLACLFNALVSFSQENTAYFSMNFNKGFGFENHEVDFQNSTVVFSPGGGLGLELEYGYYFTEWFAVGGLAAYQQIWALRYESSSGRGSQKSSGSFNRKTIAPKAEVLIYEAPDRILESLRLSVGYSFNFSGKLKRVENNIHLPVYEYDDPQGFFFNAASTVSMGKKVDSDLLLGIGFHIMKFKNSDQSINNNEFRELDGSGLELIIGFRKKIGVKPEKKN